LCPYVGRCPKTSMQTHTKNLHSNVNDIFLFIYSVNGKNVLLCGCGICNVVMSTFISLYHKWQSFEYFVNFFPLYHIWRSFKDFFLTFVSFVRRVIKKRQTNCSGRVQVQGTQPQSHKSLQLTKTEYLKPDPHPTRRVRSKAINSSWHSSRWRLQVQRFETR